jgi:hypothetical protein
MINNQPFSQNVNFYPYQDAVEKYRVSNPQALIDTDFEYSLQGSKWEQVQLINNYPSVFIRAGEPLYTGSQILFVSASHEPGVFPSSNVQRNKEVLVGLASIPDFPLQVGNPISIKETASASQFDGQYTIAKIYSLSSFSYYARNRDPSLIGNVNTPYTTLYTGGFFNGSQLPLSSLAAIPNSNDVRAVFRTPHGMFVGSPIYVVDPCGPNSSTTLENPVVKSYVSLRNQLNPSQVRTCSILDDYMVEMDPFPNTTDEGIVLIIMLFYICHQCPLVFDTVGHINRYRLNLCYYVLNNELPIVGAF